MFERRLKIILAMLVLGSALLAARAAQLQILDRVQYASDARDLMKQREFVETNRGNILDFKGRILATDEPCLDACVDYRAITDDPDADWVTAAALKRAAQRDDYAHAGSAVRKQIRDDEASMFRRDIQAMWLLLGQVSGKSPDEIAEIRHDIVQRVEMQRRYLWYLDYEAALRDQKSAATTKPAWYQSWLTGESNDVPQLDNFVIDVLEQRQPHVVLHAITPETYNLLAKNLERFRPALLLRPGTHRVYPFGEAAAHIMGRLSPVDRDDLANDPFRDDELRRYWKTDMIGHGGIEGLCEETLRGTRGRVLKFGGTDQVAGSSDPVPGHDVRLSVDIELETDIRQAFMKRRSYDNGDGTFEVRENQHGAVVVVDVATGQVRAMLSYPDFDPNTLDTEYGQLLRDDLNKPLFNRATQAQLEPGSSVKTVVGLGAITHGFATSTSTIECTGYLVINGVTYHTLGKCWVAKQYEYLVKEGKLATIAHHPVPLDDPHPTGFLTITDALERSCNVQFETLADRMGMRELSYWMNQFGLGRPTGVGIAEASGHIPNIDHIPAAVRKSATWFAGIGQGEVRATPIQMANVAATIARDGIWMRPRLLVDASDAVSATTRPSIPERADLGLTQEALTAVKNGMDRVVNSLAGTGIQIRGPRGQHDALSDFEVAGKTGSAQAAKMTIPIRDPNTGNVLLADGHVQTRTVELGEPDTQTWYVGVGQQNQDLVHAWYIGFAPFDHPQVAFCVLVEYGGSGGRVAGDIAHDVLIACINHGYLVHN